MFRKTMIAMAGTTVGVASTLVGAPAQAAADPGIEATSCTDGTVRDARTKTGYLVVPSTGENTGDYDCVMGVGNRSRGVYWLQTALIICHHKDLGPTRADGIYGENTRRAVEAVQRENGITADGIYGPQTKQKVLWPIITSAGAVGCERVV